MKLESFSCVIECLHQTTFGNRMKIIETYHLSGKDVTCCKKRDLRLAKVTHLKFLITDTIVYYILNCCVLIQH